MAEQLAVMYQARSIKPIPKTDASGNNNDSPPKRKRGRPPKSRVLLPASVPESQQWSINEMPKSFGQEALPTLQQKGFYNIVIKAYSEQGFSFTANTDEAGQRTECPLCSRIHTSQLWFCIVSQWKGYQILTVKSYSPRCSLQKLWQNKGFSDFHNVKEEDYDQISFSHFQWDEVPPLTLDPEGGIQRVISGCGSKKSLRLRETIMTAAAVLEIDEDEVRVVLVTTRRAFADSKNDELIREGYDFLHYLVAKEEDIDLRTANKLTIEAESLHCLGGSLQTPHVLMLDEDETVGALWSSTTMGTNLVSNFRVMKWLMRVSTWVFCMDATPTVRGSVVLNEIAVEVNRSVTCLINDKVLLKRKAHRIKKQIDWINLIIAKVKAKERLEIVLGTKKMGDKVYDLLVNDLADLKLKVLYYCDGMTAEVKLH